MNHLHLFNIIVIILATALPVVADKPNPYQEYIDTYSPMAVEQQQAHGIPASITLAQGIIDSRA